MREIESESGAKVSIDQSTKDCGYSIVKVSGNASAVHHAQQRIQSSLALAADHQSSSSGLDAAEGWMAATSAESEDMQVEQRCVGWLLGTRGIVLKEIEQKSGARISIDQ